MTRLSPTLAAVAMRPEEIERLKKYRVIREVAAPMSGAELVAKMRENLKAPKPSGEVIAPSDFQ